MQDTGKLVTVDDYLQHLPPEAHSALTKVRQLLHNAVPESAEVISYGVPTLKLNGTYVIYFAGYKNHISIYPAPHDKALQKELAPYRTGKGTLQFQLNQPIPYDLIEKVALALLQDHHKRTSA